jgi:hypothetical protein
MYELKFQNCHFIMLEILRFRFTFLALKTTALSDYFNEKVECSFNIRANAFYIVTVI